MLYPGETAFNRPSEREKWDYWHKVWKAEANAGLTPEQRYKRAARSALRAAVASGKIAKPSSCQECGRAEKLPKRNKLGKFVFRSGRYVFIDGHHDDYSRPLDVRWLCRKCHNGHHASIKKVATSNTG